MATIDLSNKWHSIAWTRASAIISELKQRYNDTDIWWSIICNWGSQNNVIFWDMKTTHSESELESQNEFQILEWMIFEKWMN